MVADRGGVSGHNGAGKSTLARCLCGLERYCKGIVKVDGKPYKTAEADACRIEHLISDESFQRLKEAAEKRS